jgi:hypothetical protein
MNRIFTPCLTIQIADGHSLIEIKIKFGSVFYVNPDGFRDMQISNADIKLMAVIDEKAVAGRKFHRFAFLQKAGYRINLSSRQVVHDCCGAGQHARASADDFFNYRIMGGKCTSARIVVNRRSPRLEKQY